MEASFFGAVDVTPINDAAAFAEQVDAAGLSWSPPMGSEVSRASACRRPNLERFVTSFQGRLGATLVR
jgi:hypothetical protein